MPELIGTLIKIAILIGGVMTCVGYLVLLERRMAAWIQDRRGPNRVGIPLTKIRLFGLGQPLADGLKILFKEAYTPSHVNRVPYLIAPVVIFAAALASFAVVPFAGQVDLGYFGLEEPVHFTVAPLMDVGIIYMFALSGLAVYGVIVGGWSSNNKYSLLGGLRASAQIIAYEIPLGLGILGVVYLSGSLGLERIVFAQSGPSGESVITNAAYGPGVWFALIQPLGFLVFFVAAMAEAARLPFDLPEAEQELVGGYHTEYGGMRLMLFLASEFLHMITSAVLIVLLFLGGWHLPYLTGGSQETVGLLMGLGRVAVFLVKTLLVILLFMLIRWSWPRFRYDQLMDMAWKVMVPLGMVNLFLVITANELCVQNVFGAATQTICLIAVWLFSVISVAVVFWATAAEPSRNERFIPGTLSSTY